MIPENANIRKQWEITIRRRNFTKKSRLCPDRSKAEYLIKKVFYRSVYYPKATFIQIITVIIMFNAIDIKKKVHNIVY